MYRKYGTRLTWAKLVNLGVGAAAARSLLLKYYKAESWRELVMWLEAGVSLIYRSHESDAKMP